LQSNIIVLNVVYGAAKPDKKAWLRVDYITVSM